MKRKSSVTVAFVLCLFCVCSVFGCDFGSNDILSVREEAEKLRRTVSETMIEGLREHDTNAVKSLFCPASQSLPDIDAQIEKSFAFLTGNITDYTVAKELGGESYGNRYGTVTDYAFCGDIRIETDAGKRYVLTMAICYLAQYDVAENSIIGMTMYGIAEKNETYDTVAVCRAGHGWNSPFDGDCGRLAANLIRALAGHDATATRALLCPEVAQRAETAAQTESALALFTGNPVFTVRDDGLYSFAEGEEDFLCRTLGYDCLKGKNGAISGVWVHVLASPIVTDDGKEYKLDFVAYLLRDDRPERKGISYFSLKDEKSDEEIQVGEWLHDEPDR